MKDHLEGGEGDEDSEFAMGVRMLLGAAAGSGLMVAAAVVVLSWWLLSLEKSSH